MTTSFPSGVVVTGWVAEAFNIDVSHVGEDVVSNLPDYLNGASNSCAVVCVIAEGAANRAVRCWLVGIAVHAIDQQNKTSIDTCVSGLC